MAEHGLRGPVIGVSFDGTGYGTDGNIWGGEFLVCENGEMIRAAHLKYVKMIGGDSSMKEAWKSAASYIHAVYTLSDPRAEILKDMARKLAVEKGMEDDFGLCEYIAERGPQLCAERSGVEKAMCANVDLYSGLVYEALNIPNDMCTPLFATARLSGWCAHRLEEIITGKKLIRPSYKGVQDPRDYIPLGERKEAALPSSLMDPGNRAPVIKNK